MKLPAPHFTEFEGDLYDTRKPGAAGPVRTKWSVTCCNIHTLAEVKASLRAGAFTWPGGYPLFFLTRDGAALCFDCVRKQFRQIVWDFLQDASTGWRVEGVEVNYEDNELCCDHCSKKIESAYGEPESKSDLS